MTTANAPKSRLRSLRQLIAETDPDFDKDRRNETAYEFSNGRRFVQPNPLYGTSSS
jgi:hypothetical protein